jgi:EAL domain-containing protein (putative c-di-GMP-specific phosphodiesterase class I)
LAYLRRFPIDTLKIDRSFVAGLPDQAQDHTIVAAISGLARALGLEVVAEGVEQVEQRDALHQLGLHRMQGWLYSQAIDQAAMQLLLATTPVAKHA